MRPTTPTPALLLYLTALTCTVLLTGRGVTALPTSRIETRSPWGFDIHAPHIWFIGGQKNTRGLNRWPGNGFDEPFDGHHAHGVGQSERGEREVIEREGDIQAKREEQHHNIERIMAKRHAHLHIHSKRHPDPWFFRGHYQIAPGEVHEKHGKDSEQPHGVEQRAPDNQQPHAIEQRTPDTDHTHTIEQRTPDTDHPQTVYERIADPWDYKNHNWVGIAGVKFDDATNRRRGVAEGEPAVLRGGVVVRDGDERVDDHVIVTRGGGGERSTLERDMTDISERSLPAHEAHEADEEEFERGLPEERIDSEDVLERGQQHENESLERSLFTPDHDDSDILQRTLPAQEHNHSDILQRALTTPEEHHSDALLERVLTTPEEHHSDALLERTLTAQEHNDSDALLERTLTTQEEHNSHPLLERGALDNQETTLHVKRAPPLEHHAEM